MNRKRPFMCHLAGIIACLVMFSCNSVFATSEVTSAPQFVYANPEQASFWRTATNNIIALDITYPEGVQTASLSVRGHRYAADYAAVPEGAFTLTLPEANTPEAENVYELTLVFGDNTTNRVALGVIDGIHAGSEGSTRCVLDETSRHWEKVVGRAVLPIPYGTTSLTVDGQPVETGLGIAQGWYAWIPLTANTTYDLELATEAGTSDATLLSVASGMLLVLR